MCFANSSHIFNFTLFSVEHLKKKWRSLQNKLHNICAKKNEARSGASGSAGCLNPYQLAFLASMSFVTPHTKESEM